MTRGFELAQDDRGVISVRVARPPDNSFTVAMCRELAELLTSPPAGGRVLRLSGAPGVFCRGREPSGADPDAARETVEALTEATRLLAQTDLVTVAEVDGEAAGFGVGLVAQCDLAVASSSSQFWFPEVTHGLAPALVLSWLPRLVGRRQAFWLTATGQALMAIDAQRLGLINLVAEPEALSDQVDELIETVLRFSSEVLAEIKRDLRDFDAVDQSGAYRMAGDRLLLASVIKGSQPAVDGSGGPAVSLDL